MSDDTSLFSFVYNANTTAKELNNCLIKINRWAYQWKMIFNPDPSKQAQEVIISRKTKNEYHPPPAFNNNNISETNSEKYLGAVIDNHLCFEDHLKMILNKGNKTIGLLPKLQISYQDLHCSLYTKVSLDLISIMVTLNMTKLIMHHSIKTITATVQYFSRNNRSNQRHFKQKTI